MLAELFSTKSGTSPNQPLPTYILHAAVAIQPPRNDAQRMEPALVRCGACQALFSFHRQGHTTERWQRPVDRSAIDRAPDIDGHDRIYTNDLLRKSLSDASRLGKPGLALNLTRLRRDPNAPADP